MCKISQGVKNLQDFSKCIWRYVLLQSAKSQEAFQKMECQHLLAFCISKSLTSFGTNDLVKQISSPNVKPNLHVFIGLGATTPTQNRGTNGGGVVTQSLLSYHHFSQFFGLARVFHNYKIGVKEQEDMCGIQLTI